MEIQEITEKAAKLPRMIRLSPQDIDRIENQYLDKRDKESIMGYKPSPFSEAERQAALGSLYKNDYHSKRRVERAQKEFDDV